MQKCSDEAIYKILCFVKDSIVFIDNTSSECFHWSNGFIKLLQAGALKVRNIYHTKECLESEDKVVFIVSTPLNGKVLKYVERIIKNSDFTQCVVVSLLSRHVNDFLLGKEYCFEQTSHIIKSWMRNEFATVAVEYVPFVAAHIMTNKFVLPPHHQLFPALPSDVARLQAFLHSKGDKRKFNNLGDVDTAFLPHQMQASIKSLSCSLNEMFEELEVNEDCYAVGSFSRLVANELVNLPDARIRRKMASSRASVVFIDRTLDLVAPMSHTSDCILGTIYEVLPRLKNHQNDVDIDMTNLYANGNVHGLTLLPGCLAHEDDVEVDETLQTFLQFSKKDCISFINRRLKEIIKDGHVYQESEESLSVLEQIKKSLKLIKKDSDILSKHNGFLQCVMAFLNTFQNDDIDHVDEILSAEKIILQDLLDCSKDPFSQIHQLLSQKQDDRFSVTDALMLCLLIYSAGNDLSNATPAQEEKLKECLINILMDGEHKEDLLFVVGDVDASERQIRTRIADIFERFRGIGDSRNQLQNFREILLRDEYGMVRYKPLIQQVIEQILHPNKPEISDVEFCSHGLKDFIKTGFGFFMNVSKPRADDHPLLILFMVGGISWYELQAIEKTLKQYKHDIKVIIGSTRLITATDTLEQVLCSENLFVDMDN